MAVKQSTAERAIRHLLKRAIKSRDWNFVQVLFRELGTVWEEEAEKAALQASEPVTITSTRRK